MKTGLAPGKPTRIVGNPADSGKKHGGVPTQRTLDPPTKSNPVKARGPEPYHKTGKA